ncbi:GntR family transcriptional regulator [Sinosporangium siamense]|uniref:HTH gntR-type domain-containing protein n=1 Tax=Sinosporangium siamense TaxID=1367973 RepID=A0A919RLG8_9ACTN|nr:winged helix-turn-helix domain-containing protein [Sinosporangium siamense]GII95768.1 hypothetical protein Ssi02_59990 [Sinosporangium siamense]
MGEYITGGRVFPQIADRLRTRIVAGDYAAGSVMPSEAALCKEFHVARNTLRRALAVLEDERLIITVPAKGRVVVERDRLPHEPYRYRLILGELRKMIEDGISPPGSRLPSESALQRRYETSRNTVRRAYAELEQAGLITTRHGKGRYVR